MQISGNKGSGSFDIFREFSGSFDIFREFKKKKLGILAPSPSLEVKNPRRQPPIAPPILKLTRMGGSESSFITRKYYQVLVTSNICTVSSYTVDRGTMEHY